MNAQARIDAELLERLWQKSGQCLDLANALLATDEMLKSAQCGHWVRVSELEAVRRKRLSQCLAQPVSAGHSQILSEALAVMLHLNEELVALLETAKANAGIANEGRGKARDAVGHYLDVQSES